MDKFDYLQQCFADPIQFEGDEFREWLSIPENRTLYIEVLAKRDALQLKETKVDVRYEWFDFNKTTHIYIPPKKIAIRRTLFAAASVAAAACVVFFTLWQPHPQITDKQEPIYEAVVLTTQDGRIIPINTDTPEEVIESLGLLLSKEGMQYKETESAEIVLHTLSTSHDKTFRITLSDGSQVWLNGSSKLIYPQQFGLDERCVELFGEAYFEVAGDAAKPFIVRCGDVSTRVLGTAFNIDNYSNQRVCITLVEGSIEVSNGQTNIVVAHGQSLTVLESGEMVLRKVDTYTHTAWMDGYFCFEYAKLEEIMETVGRWYNMDVSYQDQSLRTLHFNFYAKRDGEVEETLKMLKGIGKVNVSVQHNTIIIE